MYLDCVYVTPVRECRLLVDCMVGVKAGVATGSLDTGVT